MLCTHGRSGFCYDDATPVERDTFAFLYGHAFDYVEQRDRDLAEEYAAHFAGAYFAEPEDAPAHSGAYGEFERWLASRG